MTLLMICLFAGLLGLLGMTWLFPLIGRYGSLLGARCRRGRKAAPTSSNRSIAILIPAHNEQDTLRRTLTSMRSAIDALHAHCSAITVRIVVGLDGCVDATGAVARSFGAEVIESERCQGKWAMIRRLARASHESDWIVLADCGIEWPTDFLIRAVQQCEKPGVVGVAPAYRSLDGGVVSEALWSFEGHLKSLESAAGGPVSIHGATVMYRTKELLRALRALGARAWLNDDVVIPLMVRLLRPDHRIVYDPSLRVFDRELSPRAHQGARREFLRRRRLVVGNIEWIRYVFPRAWSANALTATLAMRRLFRVFWAYWILLIVVPCGVIALGTTLGALSLLTLVATVISVIVAGAGVALLLPQLRSLVQSAAVSLMAPYWLLTLSTSRGVQWE